VTEQRDGDHVIAYADQETTRLEAEARAYLRRLAASLPGAVVEDVIRFGATTTQVVEEAEAVSADLIVVAVPRRRGLARLLGTPTARRFRRVTTIPLLIVPCAAPVAA
jgi:nucleotide-binding universal stress UspA family protein